MKWSLSVAMIDPKELPELARVAEDVGFDAIALPDSPIVHLVLDHPSPLEPRYRRWAQRR